MPIHKSFIKINFLVFWNKNTHTCSSVIFPLSTDSEATALSQLFFFFFSRKTSSCPAQHDSINRLVGGGHSARRLGSGPNSTLQWQASPRDRVQPITGGLAVLERGRPQRSGRCSSPWQTLSLSFRSQPKWSSKKPSQTLQSNFRSVAELIQPIVFFSYLIFIVICNP